MKRLDPDLDPDLARIVERAVAQIPVPLRSAARARRLAIVPGLGVTAALVFVVAVSLGVGRVLSDARAVGNLPPAATPSAAPHPSRVPTDLRELPDERAVLAAFESAGLSVSSIGASKDEGDLGPLLPARVFIVRAGSAGADVLFLKVRGVGPIGVCAAPGSGAGRTTYVIYVGGQRTASIDAGQDVYFLVGSDHFAIAYDPQSRDALTRGLGLVRAECLSHN